MPTPAPTSINLVDDTGFNNSVWVKWFQNLTTASDGFQPYNDNLTAISDVSSLGLIVRTSDDPTFTTREIEANSSKVSITNGDGISGNPAIDVVEENLTLNNISGILSLEKGGTNASLTAAVGSIPYSTSSAIAFLTAGSSGQLFQSNGTAAPSWTTPTYPSASGTSGKILISDGTNNVYSTPTYPNTGTSGSVISGNGTNYVEKTLVGSGLTITDGASSITFTASTNVDLIQYIFFGGF